MLATLGNGELARKAANSKLTCPTAAGLMRLTLACGGFSRCSGDDSTETLTPEVVEATDRYVGDSIYFKIGDIFYEG